MKTKRPFLSALLFLLLLAPGCTAFAKYARTDTAAPFTATAYAADGVKICLVGDENLCSVYACLLNPVTLPYWAGVNLPISVVFDLVTWPYDLLTYEGANSETKPSTASDTDPVVARLRLRAN